MDLGFDVVLLKFCCSFDFKSAKGKIIATAKQVNRMLVGQL